MRRDLTSDVTQPWNVNDSTQTQQTTNLCDPGMSMTPLKHNKLQIFVGLLRRDLVHERLQFQSNCKGNACCPFLCAHTQNVFTHNQEAGVLSVPTPTNELLLGDLIMKNLSVANTWKEPRSEGFLVRFQHCRHHHTFENVLSDLQRNTSLRLERGEREFFPATLGV